MLTKILFVLSLMPASAFAQSFEKMIDAAGKNSALTTKALDAEALKGKGFDPCAADLLNLQLTYDQWFLQHQNDFQALLASVQNELRNANTKVVSLQDLTVEINPVKGQYTSTVTLSLGQVISYFKNLNERLEGIDQTRITLLLESQEKPALNPLHVAHSQVIEAMKMMTTLLNSSLKEQQSEYAVGFTQTDRRFALEFRVAVNANGKKLAFNFPLLEKNKKLELTETQIWNLLSQEAVTLDGAAVDGRARYSEFLRANLNAKCAELLSVTFSNSPAGVPYVSFKDASDNVQIATTVRAWELMVTPTELNAKQVAIGENGSLFILGNTADAQGVRTIYRKEFSDNDFKPLIKGPMTYIAVGPNDVLFGVSTNKNVYKALPDLKKWAYFGGKGTTSKIAVTDTGLVHGLFDDKNLGALEVQSANYQIGSSDPLVSVAATDSHYYVIAKDLLFVNTGDRWFSDIANVLPAKLVQVTGKSDDGVFALTETGSVYQVTVTTMAPQMMSVRLIAQSLNEQNRIVSINANQNKQIVGLDSQGHVYLLKEKL